MALPERPCLVCFALPEEERSFRRLCGHEQGLHLVVTGMGRQNTESALATALTKLKPATVLTCGFAGGLNPVLRLNTIVSETSDARLARRLLALGAAPVRFHCSERMAVTPEEKAALHSQTAADAVEMESRWIHETCRQHGSPCATVRVISDTAQETMPLDFNQLTTPDLRMDFRKLALALLKAPHKIPALLRLQRQTQTAAETLAQFLQRCVMS